MKQKEMVISNKEGMRSKNAAYFIQVANKFNSLITIEKDNKRVNAKSIMGVLSLALTKGQTIIMTADGDDEAQAIKELEQVIKGE